MVDPDHRRFARAVRLRTGLAHLAGRAALAAAAAAALTRGVAYPWVGVAAATMAVGWVVVRTWRRWPSLTGAATAADRRFGWDELLATAVASAADPGPFAAAVRAAADAGCRSVRPSAVPVTPPVRWGWVGVAVAAAAAVAVLPRATGGPAAGRPADDFAVLTAGPTPPAADRPRVAAAGPPRRAVDPSDDRSPRPSADPVDPDAGPAGRGDASPAPRDPSGPPGVGRGRSTAAVAQRPDVTDAHPGAGAPAPHGGAAAGGGPSAPGGPGADAVAGTGTGADPLPGGMPRWSPGRTTGDAPTTAVRPAAVPAADAALVRAYFDAAAAPAGRH